MTTSRKRSHAPMALRLLNRLVATRWFEPDAIARALVISERTLTAYMAEQEEIPLDRQLCLAAFVIECVPPLARAGHNLRGQVTAAIQFHQRLISGHTQQSESSRRFS